MTPFNGMYVGISTEIWHFNYAWLYGTCVVDSIYYKIIGNYLSMCILLFLIRLLI